MAKASGGMMLAGVLGLGAVAYFMSKGGGTAAPGAAPLPPSGPITGVPLGPGPLQPAGGVRGVAPPPKGFAPGPTFTQPPYNSAVAQPRPYPQTFVSAPNMGATPLQAPVLVPAAILQSLSPCPLDANLPPDVAAQVIPLLTTSVSNADQLNMVAQAMDFAGYPLTAQCLRQKAAQNVMPSS